MICPKQNVIWYTCTYWLVQLLHPSDIDTSLTLFKRDAANLLALGATEALHYKSRIQRAVGTPMTPEWMRSWECSHSKQQDPALIPWCYFCLCFRIYAIYDSANKEIKLMLRTYWFYLIHWHALWLTTTTSASLVLKLSNTTLQFTNRECLHPCSAKAMLELLVMSTDLLAKMTIQFLLSVNPFTGFK